MRTPTFIVLNEEELTIRMFCLSSTTHVQSLPSLRTKFDDVLLCCCVLRNRVDFLFLSNGKELMTHLTGLTLQLTTRSSYL